MPATNVRCVLLEHQQRKLSERLLRLPYDWDQTDTSLSAESGDQAEPVETGALGEELEQSSVRRLVQSLWPRPWG